MTPQEFDDWKRLDHKAEDIAIKIAKEYNLSTPSGVMAALKQAATEGIWSVKGEIKNV